MGQYGLFKQNPAHKILNNQKHIPKINISAKVLETVFAKENAVTNFPIYLTREKILSKLKEALQNVANGGLFFREKKADGSFLLRFRSPSNGNDLNDIFMFHIIIKEGTNDLEDFGIFVE